MDERADGGSADVGALLDEAVETLRAIRAGEVDALVVADGSPGEQVFTLASADRPYRMFVEAMRDGAATVSDSGIVLYANRRLAELVSVPLAQIIGAPLTSLVPESHHAALAAQCAEVEAGFIELELAGDGDSRIPVRVGAWNLQVDDERLVCLTFADLTEIRNKQEQLQVAHRKAVEASRMKSEFVANMSHEIRTPLSGVIGVSRLLLDTELTDEQREYVDAVRSSGDALMGVIEEILDFSKIEAGKLELEDEPFELLGMVEEVCSILAAPAHAKGVELLSWIDADVPATVSGDCVRVRQVLTNLLSNAVKFTAAGQVFVHVKLNPAGSAAGVRFDVADTGIGIETGSVERIFDSFSQADGSTTREYGGTGLGLTISKQLVDLMGGEIGVASTDGEGSTFWYYVPLRAVAGGQPKASAPRSLPGVSVLAVDDNETSRTLLERQLGSWGATCDTAADADSAMRLLGEAQAAGTGYSVAVVDASMPGTSGMELVQQIRSSISRELPIIMLLSTGGTRELAAQAGVDCFVTKPVHQSRLWDEIGRALERASSEQASPGEGHGESSSAPHEGGTSVLLVEDNEINQLVAVRLLERHGFNVDVAANGVVALDMCRERAYEAVFMDCHMPELDGYETTAELRRREGGSERMPIIAMTASTMKGDRERCLAAGMDDYVGKPVNPDALREAIARSLDTRESTPAGDPPAGAPDGEGSRDGDLPLVDHSALAELCEDDPQMHKDLIDLFSEQSLSSVADIAQDVESGDAEALHRDAHQLKGSSASVGALRMAELSDRLSQAGRMHQLDEAPSLVEELQRAAELTGSAWTGAS